MSYALHTTEQDALDHIAAIDAELGYPCEGTLAGARGAMQWPGGVLPRTETWATPQKHPTDDAWAVPIPPDELLPATVMVKGRLQRSEQVEAICAPANATLVDELDESWAQPLPSAEPVGIGASEPVELDP